MISHILEVLFVLNLNLEAAILNLIHKDVILSELLDLLEIRPR